jgi:hypothetical protein
MFGPCRLPGTLLFASLFAPSVGSPLPTLIPNRRDISSPKVPYEYSMARAPLQIEETSSLRRSERRLRASEAISHLPEGDCFGPNDRPRNDLFPSIRCFRHSGSAGNRHRDPTTIAPPGQASIFLVCPFTLQVHRTSGPATGCLEANTLPTIPRNRVDECVAPDQLALMSAGALHFQTSNRLPRSDHPADAPSKSHEPGCCIWYLSSQPNRTIGRAAHSVIVCMPNYVFPELAR